jgi:hypothetical protein
LCFIKKPIKLKEKHPYSNRTITFETTIDGVLNEIHFDKNSNSQLSREYRFETLPKFRFDFPEKKICIEIKHQFLDEIDYGGVMFDGINIETIISEVFDDNGNSKSLTKHTIKINKEPYNYLKIATEVLERYLEGIKDKEQAESLLRDKYSNLNSSEKVNYLYGQILFEDRMQGGYPTKYKYPVVPYISKWFVDSYGKYDSDYYKTITKLLDKFEVKCSETNEMLKYDTKSDEWNKLATKSKLLN